MLRIVIFIAILIGLVFSCNGQVHSRTYRAMLKTLLSHTVPEVTVQEAVADTGIVFLDAREPREFAVSHLSGATAVGYDHFDLKSVQNIPKNQHIVVYCSVGYRSEKVTEKLLADGYTNVSNLYGGIFEWVNAGYPVINAQNQVTDQVHAFDRTWGVWLRKGKKVYN